MFICLYHLHLNISYPCHPRPEADSKVSQDVGARAPGEVTELGERDARETREAQRTHRFEIHDMMTSCILYISCILVIS